MISKSQPLAGRRLVVTRSSDQAGRLRRRLEAEGAEVLELPLIKTVPHYDLESSRKVLTELGQIDWILFTSSNGVRYFFKLFFEVFEDIRSIGLCRIGAVGEATAQAIRAQRLKVDVIPQRSTAEDLALAVQEATDIAHTRMLVVVGNRNRDTLVQSLQAASAIVDTLAVYRTDLADLSAHQAADTFRNEGADAIIFASSSAANSFKLQARHLQLVAEAQKPLGCSIGPQTTEALREAGIPVDIEAAEPSLESLVQALKERLGA